MKISILNYSGNVGKSVLAKNLFSARLADHACVCIETINDDGGNSTNTIKGADFGSLQNELIIEDNMIIDVGASNIEETLRLMNQYQGSHEDIDFYVLPVVVDSKQQVDTLNTIGELVKTGIHKDKIIIILNKVENPDDIASDFSSIKTFAESQKIKLLSTPVFYNEVYQSLRQKGVTLTEFMQTKDLKAKLKAETDATKKRAIAQEIGLQRLGKTAINNLDAVFDEFMLVTKAKQTK